MGWAGRWEGGSGWETHVNPWLIHVNIWQPLQYCKVISLQLIKNKWEKKERCGKENWDLLRSSSLQLGRWVGHHATLQAVSHSPSPAPLHLHCSVSPWGIQHCPQSELNTACLHFLPSQERAENRQKATPNQHYKHPYTGPCTAG